MSAMKQRRKAPKESVALGDPALLRMDISAASKFWNVERPIGRRDRKSGAKKRRQHEIEAQLQLLLAAE
jgi:DNA (cytosine-5)-methyltransferase 1